MQTIPTNTGEASIPSIMSSLMYASYAANRDYGMRHEAYVRLLSLSDEKAASFLTRYIAEGTQ